MGDAGGIWDFEGEILVKSKKVEINGEINGSLYACYS